MTTSTHPLTDLVSILETAGVDIHRSGEREITGRCPVHHRVVGRDDKSPSWSINASTGLWICFSCGARGTLTSLLSELLGTHESLSIQKFLITNSYNALSTNPQTKQESAHVQDASSFFEFPRVSDTKCLYKNLDPELVFRYGVRWNPDNKSWCIPIISPIGRLEGWQEKKSDWVRNYPIGVKKAQTLFGVERFKCRTAVLVESPLDIIRFASVYANPQALASFGAWVSKEQMTLLTHVADSVIVAMDNDDPGIEACKRIYKSLPPPRKGIRWWDYSGTDAKDIGDMSDDEIVHGFENATVIPPWIV